MFIKIYFDDKPVFLCDKIDNTINEYMHHPDAVFIDEISTSAINSLLHEIAKSQFHAGILIDKDLNKLKKAFFKHFDIVTAAGGVVYNNDTKEILMIFRRGKWDLPKGKLDRGETLEQCAVREVEEETGLKVELGKKLTITYHTYTEFGKHILKESHWYKMRSNKAQKLVPQTEEQITDIKWVKPDDLEKYLANTFQNISEVLSLVKGK